MIPINELRVGCTIEMRSDADNQQWEVITVTGIARTNDSYKSYMAHYDRGCVNVENLGTGTDPHYIVRPIPITPKILEQCGVIPAMGYRRFQTRQTVAITQYDDTQCRVWHSGNYVGILHLQYIHQLQNLFYCLTGQELPYNA